MFSLPKDLYYDKEAEDKDKREEEMAKKKANRPSMIQELCSFYNIILHIFTLLEIKRYSFVNQIRKFVSIALIMLFSFLFLEYIKRVIVHPAFRNISFKDAEKLLADMEQGECIVRPSSKV